MHPRSFAWFGMAETHFTDEQSYKKLRVTWDTFAFLLQIPADISRIDASIRTTISVTHRLAVTLPENRTIANLLWGFVSRADMDS